MPDRMSPSPDRRQRKSRAALRLAMAQLLAAKPYDAITVEDIADAADLTRATFYAHYADRAALLREVSDEIFRDLVANVRQALPPDTTVFTGVAAIAVFEHARSNADLYRAVLSGAAGSEPRARLAEIFQDALQEIFSNMTEQIGVKPRVPISFVSGIYVATVLHMVGEFVDGQLEGSVTEIGELLVQTMFGGISWALSLSEENLRLPGLR